MKVHGNLNGLKPGHKQRLERLYDRKVPREAIISVPLAQSLCELSSETGRQVGVTLDRAGKVQHVIVGDAERLFIPDLGRARAGAGRFRGIRLVHTHLHDEPLTSDDLTDLARLRLDLIAALGVDPEGRPRHLYHAHLMPAGSESATSTPTTTTVHAEDLDFSVFIENLEGEFSRRTLGAVETEGQVRAIAVHVTTGAKGAIDPDESLRELAELARTADVVMVDRMVQKRPQLDPRY